MITIHQRYRQTDGQTDRQTTCDRNTALCTKVHRAVKSVMKIFHKRDITCGRTLSPPLSHCHISSDPLPPLQAWHIFWMPPNY